LSDIFSSIAFDTIRFGMAPEEITEALIEEDIKNKPMLVKNKDFSKPIKRKILGVTHEAQLAFNYNKLQQVTFTSDNFSFAHCLQETEYIFGVFIEHYIFDKPEKDINLVDVLANYKISFLQPLIKLRKGKSLAFPVHSPEGTDIKSGFEVLCNEHAMGKRNYTLQFKKRCAQMDITIAKQRSRFSMGRIMNRDL